MKKKKTAKQKQNHGKKKKGKTKMERTEEEIICSKCLLEGVESQLSKPEKTEEGWIQYCEKGHKLYVWCHVRREDDLSIDLLNKEVYVLPGASKN